MAHQDCSRKVEAIPSGFGLDTVDGLRNILERAGVAAARLVRATVANAPNRNTMLS
jgi:hypothetical protein